MDIVSPKMDFCAKELFANPVICKYFISDSTGMKVEDIRSVRICNPFLWKRYKKQKQGILDVLVVLNDNTKVMIELQIKMFSHWDRRNLFYLAKSFTEELRVGEKYERLKRIISIL